MSVRRQRILGEGVSTPSLSVRVLVAFRGVRMWMMGEILDKSGSLYVSLSKNETISK